METRLIDFLFAAALVLFCVSGTTLMAYAVGKIGLELLQAMNRLLTVWDYHRNGPEDRAWMRRQPGIRDLLTMATLFDRIAPPRLAYARDLKRLADYRYAKARQRDEDSIWDRRLGALLTPDEYEHLYGELRVES